MALDADGSRNAGPRLPRGVLRMLAVGAASLLALSACAAPHAAQAPAAAATTATRAAAVSEACPDDLVASVDDGYGTHDRSTRTDVAAALGIELPTASTCVLLKQSSDGSTSYLVFWPGQEESFAAALGRAFLSAGYRPGNEGETFTTNGADGRVDVDPPGDSNWSGYFDGDGVVLLSGSFEGEPGVQKTPIRGQRAGAVLTWKSACMLTRAELDDVWTSKAIRFAAPAPADGASTACEYAEKDVALPRSVDVDFHPYGGQGTRGWGTENSTWTAPSAKVAARNSCAAARRAEAASSWPAICGRTGGVRFVIAADRLGAAVFPAGDYFYTVDLLQIGGDDSLTAPLHRTAQLLADRTPAAK